MDAKWRISCGLSLIFTMCALSSLFVLIAARPTPQSTQTAHGHSSQSRGGSLSQMYVQILDREFTPPDLRQGQAIYTERCAVCHGADGQGQFPFAPFDPDSTGRIGAPPHDGTGHTWHHSDVVLIRYVTEGGFSDLTRFYKMPPFGEILTDEQILQVIAYIKTFWSAEQREDQRILTEEEQKLFSN